MKHWQELGQILERVLSPCPRGPARRPRHVTRIRGSAYRRPGARLLIETDGAALGGISGGCLEEDVREVGPAGAAHRPLARCCTTRRAPTTRRSGASGSAATARWTSPSSPSRSKPRSAPGRGCARCSRGTSRSRSSLAAEDGGRAQVLVAGESGRLAGAPRRRRRRRARRSRPRSRRPARRRSSCTRMAGRTVFTEVLRAAADAARVRRRRRRPAPRRPRPPASASASSSPTTAPPMLTAERFPQAHAVVLDAPGRRVGGAARETRTPTRW